MDDDVAIVGLSLKLPQDVDDVSGFWEVLQNRTNLMTEWPKSRINNSFFESGKVNCNGGHFINEDPGAFDAPFFSVTPKEASSMDPMQRWTLEASYRAFENAGIPAESLRGSRTAVFSASMTDDYKRMIAQDPDDAPRMAATGTFPSIIPNRVSWYFDLCGPSVHVDTACSSSLLAVDLACQSLRNGDASSVLVTGSNLILGPTIYQMLSSLNFLSPDSKCHSFDHRANGYARGEGIIALVAKPLTSALRDGDMIRAVIRSTGSNQDGHTPSLTQPNPQAQESLIRQVYQKANLSFDSTRYFEAHGTGTPVGDPIEMKAIGRVFRSSRSTEEPLYVGSVKANIGHLEGCSGLAGIVKSILILEHGIIVPNALFEKMNPRIDAEFYNVAVPTASVVWPNKGLRRVSVNSFGFGGANTHIVMDDALNYLHDRGLSGNHCTILSPEIDPPSRPLCNGRAAANGDALNETDHTNGTSELNGSLHISGNGQINGAHPRLDRPLNGTSLNGHSHSPPQRLLVWTAADEKALQRMTGCYDSFYKERISGSPSRLDKLSYTLAMKRSKMLWRTFAIVDGTDGNRELSLSTSKLIRSSKPGGMAFIFTGQGAQYVEMGLELAQYPAYKETLIKMDDIYRNLGCQWSIFEELHDRENINHAEYSQPLSTALQVALVELLKTFGVAPKAVVGHSSGEIAAAYTVGALSLESVCKVSLFRGELAGKLRAKSTAAPGAMMSVNLPESEVEDYLRGVGDSDIVSSINIACINSPLNCTLSGDEGSIDAVKQQLDKDGIFAQKLKTGVAYHSPYMMDISDEYLSKMGALGAGATKANIPMISTVTGRSVNPSTLTKPQYWVDNMVSPVRFSEAVHMLAYKASTLKVGMGKISDMIEVGPHPALKRPVQDILSQAGARKLDIRYNSVLHRSRPAVQSMLEFMGQLFCHGHAVSVTAANGQEPSRTKSPFLVNCPEYPFDHSKVYWAESRLSRDFRLRESVSGETLGFRMHDWNPLDPRWRNFLSIDSTQWIGDHVVSDTVLYPAAGMLVMALEAAQQMSNPDRTIHGYFVKEAHFKNPIVVGETLEDKTETMLHLRPPRATDNQDSTWSDITIFSRSSGEWIENLQAKIKVQYQDQMTQDARIEQRLAHEGVLSRYRHAAGTCTLPINSQVFYEDAAECGLKYGEWFRVLEDIRWDREANTIARIDVSHSKHRTSSLVHPGILDAAFQVLRVSTTAGLSLSSDTNVPVRISDAWISHTGWQSPLTSSVKYLATSEIRNDRESEEGTIFAFADDGKILCRMNKAETAAVSRGSKGDQSKKLLYGVEWKPQLSLLEPKQLEEVCDSLTPVKDEDTMLDHHTKLRVIMNTVVFKTLETLTEEDRERVPDGLRRHIKWMEQHLKGLPDSEFADGLKDAELEQRLTEIESLRPPWKLHTTVIRRLKAMLSGELDPLEVIFNSDQADVFYEDMFENVCDERMVKLLDLATHENPGLRILEVGAGTGGMTSRVLAALRNLEEQTGTLRFSEYTYTDVSPAFFEKASAKWEQFKGRMTFKTFDMKISPEKQGIDVSSYDMVIAGSVLHATEDLMETIRNVRKTLKPKGLLLLLEVIAPQDVVTNFTFGLVPGWWGSREPWRGLSPAITEDQWNERLKEAGFTGNEVCLRDYRNDECHIFSIILSRVEEDAQTTGRSPGVFVVTDGAAHSQMDLRDALMDNQLQMCARSVMATSLTTIHEVPLTAEDIVIVIAEVGKPLLANLPEEKFQSIQNLIKKAQNLLWVTKAARESGNNPEYGVMQGFLRSIRAESTDKNIVSLAISDENDAPIVNARHIVKVLEATFDAKSNELEYIVRDQQLTTGRVFENVSTNQKLASLLHPQSDTSNWLTGPALKLSVGASKTVESLEFVEDATYQSELSPHEVELEAKAWGVDIVDVMTALGRYDNQLGADCAGIVTRVGSDCDPAIRPGDRVCMVSDGCMKAYPRGLDSTAVKIPQSIPFEKAVSVISPGITSFYSLLEVARLRSKDKILIHNAMSSIGQAGIWIAKWKGAEIFATAESEEGRSFICKTYDIPEDHVFSTHPASFSLGTMRVTLGFGVDVALNILNINDIEAICECMAPFGRIVDISVGDSRHISSLALSIMERNVTFSKVNLRHLIQSDKETTSKLLKGTINLLIDGNLRVPENLHVHSASEIHKAFSYAQDNRSTSRVAVSPRAEDRVSRSIRKQNPWKLDGNASYLVAGGLGGLGRSILRWMVERGARYLVVPSRSGVISKAALDTVAELKDNGVTIVTPKCDVSSNTSLAAVLEDYARTMPPIKGCINATMVLQDAVFESMTYSQWDLTIKSKVQTSRNLHDLLPQSLDFFILLSSLNGVCGSMAQCNYAGGCTFQDALARCRVESGQKAFSVDIGWMRNVGIVAETDAYQRQRKSLDDMQKIDERELLALLSVVCDPEKQLASGRDSQILFGPRTPAEFLAKGQPVPLVLDRPLFAAFSHVVGDAKRGDAAEAVDQAAAFIQAGDTNERIQIVVKALSAKLARAMSISADDVQLDKPLSSYGVDSLMAVELRNWISKEFKATVAVFDILGNTPIAAIGDLVAAKSSIGKEQASS